MGSGETMSTLKFLPSISKYQGLGTVTIKVNQTFKKNKETDFICCFISCDLTITGDRFGELCLQRFLCVKS